MAEQIALSMPARRLWIDIRAQKEAQNALILVEVKGFDTVASPVAYLADAIGQCVLYQAILEYVGITDQLYMAVPAAAFERRKRTPELEVALLREANHQGSSVRA